MDEGGCGIPTESHVYSASTIASINMNTYAVPNPDMLVDISMEDSSSTKTVFPKESKAAVILFLSFESMLSVQLHPQRNH